MDMQDNRNIEATMRHRHGVGSTEAERDREEYSAAHRGVEPGPRHQAVASLRKVLTPDATGVSCRPVRYGAPFAPFSFSKKAFASGCSSSAAWRSSGTMADEGHAHPVDQGECAAKRNWGKLRAIV